jgi:hypothetical protein
MKVRPEDKKKYLLLKDQDYEILEKIYKLEKKELSFEDKKMVKFLRTQLERDWRTPLVKFLDQLLKKYK